ncbi:hypothetical protein S83_058430 [Arachis hypogaea]
MNEGTMKAPEEMVNGSFSRSVVNFMAGCQTVVSNIVMSVGVFLTLEFITPFFCYTPNAILSSIIISVVINLVDYQATILIWKIDKFDFVACMGAFFVLFFATVEIGLLIAVSISFAKILLQVHRCKQQTPSPLKPQPDASLPPPPKPRPDAALLIAVVQTSPSHKKMIQAEQTISDFSAGLPFFSIAHKEKFRPTKEGRIPSQALLSSLL